MQMNRITLIMFGLLVVAIIIAFLKGDNTHIEGLKVGGKMIIRMFPLLIVAFLLAGFIETLIPREFIGKWMGAGSGWKGLLVGTLAGGLTPGGPYVCFPIIAGLWKSGAAIGPLVAYLTGWSLLAVNRIPYEIGFIGAKFALVRIASTIIFPPIAGWIAQTVFGRFMA
jgi:uncharacterized membrane protein YraQ (UPF0718 family)